ncbi:hypothetical protein DITRI_Ditri10aG0048100 [Diplodiscus trichospermus]
MESLEKMTVPGVRGGAVISDWNGCILKREKMGPYIEEVKKAQLTMDLPIVKCVDAKGLPLALGGLHLTTLTQVKLDKKLADAFLQLIPSPLRSNDALSNCSSFVPYFLIMAQIFRCL